ncbi:MAG: hypothetical protein D6758_09625, partial [Gammaproteobacteria bacterium]
MPARLLHLLMLTGFLLVPRLAMAAPVVPAPLSPWQDWVLRDVRDADCTRLDDQDGRGCVWPGELIMQPSGEVLTFVWDLVTQAEVWVGVPGSAGQWPFDVRLNGQDVPVLQRAGRPVVSLAAGRWRLTGRVRPDARQGRVPMPPEAARIVLRGSSGWGLDTENQLRRLAPVSEEKGDAPRVRVHRLLTLERPATLQTRIQVES